MNPAISKLSVGDRAPWFSGPDQDGKTVTLDDYKGRKLILYFYPKDDTPGCTAQSCNLRDNIYSLRSQGYEVLGVSPDPEASHRKFKKKYKLPFRLLADPERKVIEAFGVWGWKKFMGRDYEGVLRTTFIIGPGGMIERIIPQVDTQEHTAQILGNSEIQNTNN